MDVSALRSARAGQPFTAARSSYAGRRLGLGGKPLAPQGRRSALRCKAVAEVDVEKRGEARVQASGGGGPGGGGGWHRRRRLPHASGCSRTKFSA